MNSRPDRDVAYDMVRVVGSEYLEAWEDNPKFAEVLDLVEHLETADGNPSERAMMWRRVRRLVGPVD
jgi:hypothetical protein